MFRLSQSLTVVLTVMALIAALLAPVSQVRAASIIRVTPTGATSGACGSTWASACSLQHALTDIAASGDEVWVAAGTYKPTTGSDRNATFTLRSGVKVYGGFVGTETARDQRNWTTNVTTLSGEIGAAGNSDNAYHVIVADYVDAMAVLDGFTVTGGNADDMASDCAGAMCGGGLRSWQGGPTLANITFSHNAGRKGGGMYVYQANPALTNIVFDDNEAADSGGGLYLDNQSNPTLSYVRFVNNRALYGGGMYEYFSTGMLNDCLFTSNTADVAGGGMHNSNSAPTLIGVTFYANAVNSSNSGGGGMYNDWSKPLLFGVTFNGNQATGGYGGALYNDVGSAPALTNVTFDHNLAAMNAGLNGGHGGAVYVYTGATLEMTNVTFKGNAAVGYDRNHPGSGGALLVLGSAITLTHAILWGNTPDQVHNSDDPTTIINVSIVQNGCPADSTCSGIITADPLLGDLGNYGGSVQTIPLLPGSSALDTGYDAGCPATDARGVSRPQGAHCDIGAFESSRFTLVITGGNNQSALINTAFAQPLQVSITPNNGVEPVNGGKVTFTPPASGASAGLATTPATIAGGAASVNATANGIRGAYLVTATMAGASNSVGFSLRNLSPTILYVKPTASGAGNCADWANACTLQTALGQATSGDEIWVAAGTYKPTSGSDRNATFQLVSGAALYGGFTGTETARSQRNWNVNRVTLSGEIGGESSGDNVYHVVTANSTDAFTVLDGVTVAHGYGDGQVGGGIYVNGGSLTLANCRLSYNFAGYGGGLFQGGVGGQIDISNSQIDQNMSANHGGGLYVDGNVRLENTQVFSNTATWHGGGLHVQSGTAMLVGGRIAGNRTLSGNGGGVNVNNAVTISGTQFISNSANSNGGGLVQWNAGYTVTVTGARFERNAASNGDGGGLYLRGNTSIATTTVYNNSAKNWGGGLYLQNGNLAVTDSAITANMSGSNGGGVALNGGTARFSRSLILGNNTLTHGGGIDVWTSHLKLTNVVIADNHATLGNGIYLYESPLEGAHLTLARNSGGQGSGIYVNGNTPALNTVTLTDTIVASHTIGIQTAVTNTISLIGVLWYANGIRVNQLAGTWSEQYDYHGDPAFAADGYHLTAKSAAIDHGINANVTTDIDGESRPAGNGYDLGTDEFHYKIYLPLVLRQY